MDTLSPLTLADLEAFDPHAPEPAGPGERRFLCPLCGHNKPKDTAHRCFCLNSSNGLYHCKRCNSKGQLKENWKARDTKSLATIRAQKLQRAFEVRVPALEPIPVAPNTDPNAIWNDTHPLEGTRGEKYLLGRGISLEVAQWSNVRFTKTWYGRETVVFPFGNEMGKLVAVSGRTVADGGLDKPANGTKKQGVFRALWREFDPFHPEVPLIICEAPLDALSLAQVGFAALALGGTSTPPWLDRKAAFRRVVLALDADGPGDKASGQLARHLASFGARCARLRPEGCKDWNAWLQEDVDGLQEFLDVQLLGGTLFE